ncbi:MAG TPA: hypothetical protein VGX16_04465 [Solirubrobacteraceae bacterium]|nr:hypothetical protein [Solirubrobacteraceae bacterium]
MASRAVSRTSGRSRARPWGRLSGRLLGGGALVLGALLLRLLAGVGFANYDTLYALLWGQQLSRGETPLYGVPVAPTPHPLLEALGLLLSPLGPAAAEGVTVALGFLALAGCGWVIYRLGAAWFGRAAGALAALILLTRMPILAYGVRAYADIPYLLLLLSALLVETRRPRAGAPVLALLALAGLLRPEAWAFSGIYWLYLAAPALRGSRGLEEEPGAGVAPGEPPDRARLARLALLAASAPLLWMLGDLLVTGNPLWSLTNTRSTAQTLDRVRGIGKVPEYIPRRIGEILRPPVLVGAALGGVLSLLWLPARSSVRTGALAGALAVLVFAAFATVGLPIDTRYAFPVAAILALFCAAGVLGWVGLEKGDPRRRLWMAAGPSSQWGSSPTRPRSTARSTVKCAASAARRRSRGTSSRSWRTTLSPSAAARWGFPTTAPSPSSRSVCARAPRTS